jgi:hypothetical protein
MSQEKTCLNCKWWDSKDKKEGVCQLAQWKGSVSREPLKYKTKAYAQAEFEEYQADLYTEFDFGCNQFESHPQQL